MSEQSAVFTTVNADDPASVKCEVLAGRGEDAMPWGWRPSQGPPPPHASAPDPGVADRGLSTLRRATSTLGNPVLHGALLLLVLALVGLILK